jgi:hypothetical protein
MVVAAGWTVATPRLNRVLYRPPKETTPKGVVFFLPESKIIKIVYRLML